MPITYTSSNPAVATVSGSTVTIIGTGSATITTTQEGNNNYNPAGGFSVPSVEPLPDLLVIVSVEPSGTFPALHVRCRI